jgi:putative phosphoesterase
MRIAALYDIHGNIHALDAVLAEVVDSGPDLIVVGGDVASGPFPRATIERLMDLPLPSRFVMGNADRELIEAFVGSDGDPSALGSSTEWCARQLTEYEVEFIRKFERLVSVEVDGTRLVTFCHGSPRSDEELITPVTPVERVAPMLLGVGSKIVVCGHTHMQFDRRIAGVRLVNAGSVGMPYARAPGAYWALVGQDVDLRHTMYDVDAAAAAIRACEWPEATEFANENVVRVPSSEEAIAIFEPETPA